MFDSTAKISTMTCFLCISVLILILIGHAAIYASVEELEFWTGLEGEFEKPQLDTNASGMAVFKSTPGNIWYQINITGIDKVTAAHIHSGALGEKGPILASLFRSNGTITGNINGTLTQGIITGEMLEGPLVSDQLSEIALGMKNGSTYVDVHTVDYPNGEVRGQIMSANSTHAELMM